MPRGYVTQGGVTPGDLLPRVSGHKRGCNITEGDIMKVRVYKA